MNGMHLRALFVSGALVGLAGCRPSPSTSDVMWRHFERVGHMEQAVVAADLARAKELAGVIATSDSFPGLPPSARPYEAALRDQARIGAAAPDLGAAGRSLAGMGKACGDCHQSLKRGPRFAAAVRPQPTDQPVTSAMVRHRWAVDQMWAGLIGPSDSAWVRGAQALQEESTYDQLFRAGVPRGDAMRALAQNVRSLGAQAERERDRDQQAVLYGRLMATCNSCHELARAR